MVLEPYFYSSKVLPAYRLEDVAGTHCHLVRDNRVDQALLDKIGATAIFISGNSFAPDGSAPDATELPVFVALPPPDEHGDDPMLITTKDGRAFEYGYHPIELSVENSGHPLLGGLGEQPVFRHAHGLHVPELPNGFTNLASTAATPIQMAVHDERRIIGTQFHPEYWTDEHPDGRTLIANFLSWSQRSPT